LGSYGLNPVCIYKQVMVLQSLQSYYYEGDKLIKFCSISTTQKNQVSLTCAI